MGPIPLKGPRHRLYPRSSRIERNAEGSDITRSTEKRRKPREARRVPPRRPRGRLGREGAPLLPPGQVPLSSSSTSAVRQVHAVREPRANTHVGPLSGHQTLLARHLGINRRQFPPARVGSTLALAYDARTHPDRVRSSSCAESSCCAGRRSSGYTRKAPRSSFPDAWEPYFAPIPKSSAATS